MIHLKPLGSIDILPPRESGAGGFDAFERATMREIVRAFSGQAPAPARPAPLHPEGCPEALRAARRRLDPPGR